jgi:hypothetical protein
MSGLKYLKGKHAVKQLEEAGGIGVPVPVGVLLVSGSIPGYTPGKRLATWRITHRVEG